ncbi:MAG TPA: isochorismatase family cysteine hydrolase [Steroidobacteraceae bacterium]|nr:isochorismatase family cysteine hydrolase [Steroidobacteraceae bacterium]
MSGARSDEWQVKDGTALVLIDVQNNFFHPDGGNYFPAAPEIVGNLQVLLSSARRSGALIVHVADRHRPGQPDFELHKLPGHCVQGEFDSEFFESFGPSAAQGGNEILVAKRRFSAFMQTDLDLALRENGIERLVVAGVKTNVCVRATIQDGFGLGYKCLLVTDATSSNRPKLAESSAEDVDRYMGWAVSMEDAVAALA